MPRARRAEPTSPTPAVRRSHRRRAPRWRGRLWAALIALGLLGLGARLAPGSPLGPSGEATVRPALPPLLLRPAEVRVEHAGFLSWALLDQRTGDVAGSTNQTARSTTASMIKVWLAADYLRRAATTGLRPTEARLHLLSIMIRDSDNDAAQTVWRELGGAVTIRRLISTCSLTDSAATDRWSTTALSARDAARMGACVADGRAAGPQWTSWLLTEMREVRGEGDFGIRKALPAPEQSQTAIKNGWILRDEDNNWHVNCLAVGDGWVLSILQRYPQNLGFSYGRNACKSVTQQLLSAS